MIERRPQAPDGAQLGHGAGPVVDEQVSGERASGAAEQLGIADVQDRGKLGQVPARTSRTLRNRIAAADQVEVSRRGRLRMVAENYSSAR